MRKFWLILMLCLCGSIVLADDAAPDFFPSPESLFTDAVQVVDVGTNRYFAPENSPHLFYSDVNNQRILRVNRDTWQQDILPYPDGVWFVALNQNARVLERDNVLYVDTGSSTNQVWLLDIQAFTFEPYHSLCRVDTLTVETLAESWQRGWILADNSTHDRRVICDIQTGETLQTLPDLNIISISPDAEWLLIHGDIDHDFRESDKLYGYEIATGRQHFLGNIYDETLNLPSTIAHNVWRWFGHTALIPLRDDPEWSMQYVYRVEVDTPDSLKLALTRYRFQATDAYLDNPPRFDFVAGMEGGYNGQCLREIYNILEDKLEVYKSVSLCYPDYGSPNGTGYYRDIHGHQTGYTASLVRANPFTGEREMLLEDKEIEWIVWISPDEHYATLILDNNGTIETDPRDHSLGWSKPEHPRLVLIDLITGKTRYSLPVTWDGDVFRTVSQFLRSSITPVADNRFIVIDENQDNQALLLELAPDTLSQTPLMTGALFVIPSTGQIFYQDDSGMVWLTSVDGKDAVPVMTVDSTQYQLEFAEQPNGLIDITLWQTGTEWVFNERMTYTVRVQYRG